jgi:hypothetical protein
MPRPSFAQENSSDTHFETIGSLPEDEIATIKQEAKLQLPRKTD